MKQKTTIYQHLSIVKFEFENWRRDRDKYQILNSRFSIFKKYDVKV